MNRHPNRIPQTGDSFIYLPDEPGLFGDITETIETVLESYRSTHLVSYHGGDMGAEMECVIRWDPNRAAFVRVGNS